MLFNTAQFALFFAVVWAVYRLLSPTVRQRWLLATSMVFYTLWIPQYLLLLALDVIVSAIRSTGKIGIPVPGRNFPCL